MSFYTYKKVVPSSENHWTCDECGDIVEAKLIPEVNLLIPVSLYWNATKQVAYCSPECSLQGHTKE